MPCDHRSGAELLELSDVRKSYGDKVVLADIDLTVDRHDVVCLIGSSGSGKSTLLRCLNLLEQIDDGMIRFDGEEISDPRVDPRAVRRRIGMVFQAYNLFPHLTVLENCVLAPVRVHGVPRAEATQRARDLLDRFGLSDQADKHPDRLSGGQQQRAALVRALCTAARAAAARRDHRGARPRAGRRRAHDRARPRRGRHHDGAGHPRDELRPRRRHQGLLPRRRPDPRAGAAVAAAGRAASRSGPGSSCAACCPGPTDAPTYPRRVRPRLALLLGALVVPALPLVDRRARARPTPTSSASTDPPTTDCLPRPATIPAAIPAAATDGADSVIRIGPGTYTDGPYVFDGSGSPLTVQGSNNGTGANATLLRPPRAGPYATATEATVRNLRVTLTGTGGVGLAVSGVNGLSAVTSSSATPRRAPRATPSASGPPGAKVQGSTVNLVRGAGQHRRSWSRARRASSRSTTRTSSAGVVASRRHARHRQLRPRPRRRGHAGLRAGTEASTGTSTVDARHLTVVGGAPALPRRVGLRRRRRGRDAR